MADDPSVFAYDEVYDDMQTAKQANDPRVKLKKVRGFLFVCLDSQNLKEEGKRPAPKYIAQLKKSAEERQREFLLVEERKACSFVYFMTSHDRCRPIVSVRRKEKLLLEQSSL
jgi:hypothetical protein